MMRCHIKKSKQQGFTLLEVMISIIILSIGLLGLAALQLTALRNNTSAYNRSIATILAYDIADRMRANKVATDANSYIIDVGTAPSNAASCVGAGKNCDAAGLAAFDLDEWKCQLGAYNDTADGVCAGLGLSGDLPFGDGEITRAGNIFTITIMWDDERNGVDVNANNCGSDPVNNVTCFAMAFEPPAL